MDEYRIIRGYNPANTKITGVNIQDELLPGLIESTGISIQDEIVPVVFETPDVTGINEVIKESEPDLPDYLKPEGIDIKTYWLKK